MRFISKLTMTVAAIFFALSVSAHAGGHDTTSNSLGSKVYQVCKKWRVDQGGWMATDQMQHCRTVLFCASNAVGNDDISQKQFTPEKMTELSNGLRNNKSIVQLVCET